MEKIVREWLLALGEDPEREGLRASPASVAETYRELSAGNRVNPQEILAEGIFDATGEQMVLCRDIQFYSLCERHMLPFFGQCHIGLIPRGRAVGLSRLVRLVEAFSRRLQVQDRLTRQIAETLEIVLEPEGVGVVVEALHLCSAMRGVRQQAAHVTTSTMLGRFEVHGPTREEFLHYLQRPGR